MVIEVGNVIYGVTLGQVVVMTAWGVITRVFIGVQICMSSRGMLCIKKIGIWGQECQIRGQF